MTPLDSAATMTNHADTTLTENATENDNTTTIATRFGTFEIDPAKAIEMPQGPIGFTDLKSFAILDAPDAPNSPFKLFQSLEDPGVTFLVTVLPAESDLIEDADLQAACDSYAIDRENAAYLLIVKVRQQPDGTAQTTVNLRAPLLVDSLHRVARQAVFAGEKYSMQYQIG